jgi:hypothetical protein
MPREARTDAPGALQHIIVRGIERRRQILPDDNDRGLFVVHLMAILLENTVRCYAWALNPNHRNLRFRARKIPIATVMRRLFTRYALAFNRRHRCHGPLFQILYKSILCQQKPYLPEPMQF